MTILTKAVVFNTGAAAAGIDVTTFSTLGSGTNWVTIGHPFTAADIASGRMPVLTDTGNNVLANQQTNLKAAHGDSSVRHALITALLTSGTSYKIRSVAAATPTPISGWKSLAASAMGTWNVVFSAGVTATVDVTAQLLAQADDLWLSGPACMETRIVVDASTKIRLYTDIRYFSDGNVRVDLGIENPWVYGGLRSDVSYTFTVTAFGAAQSPRAVSHVANARIRQTFWKTTPAVVPRHNTTYLKTTLAVPNYANPSAVAQITNTTLANLPQAVNVLTSGGYIPQMETGGLDNGIGPLPHHQAVFLLSNSDTRTWTSVVNQVNGGGAYSNHARDAATGLPVNIVTHPNGSYSTTGDFDTGGTCAGDGTAAGIGTGLGTYHADCSHLPSIAYLPYLLAGDRWSLDELMFWGNWAVLSPEQSVGGRGGAQGRIRGQVRGLAWGLRELARAAYIVPDAHALKSYFNTLLSNNATRLTTDYASGQPSFNNFGAYDQDTVDGAGTGDQTRVASKTWMDDFLTWSVGEIISMGFSGWQTFFDYKALFPIGRVGGTEFPFMASGQDVIRLNNGAAGGPFLTTWTQVASGSSTGLTILPAPYSGNPTVAQATTLNSIGEFNGVFSMGIPRGYPPLPGSRFGTMFIGAAPVVDRRTTGWQRLWGRLQAAIKIPNTTFGPPRPNWVDDLNGGCANAVWPRFTTTGVPLYIQNITPGNCLQISGTKFDSVSPNTSGVVNPGGAVGAYSGAVWDPINLQYIVNGGGHVDSNRNEVYVWRPFSSETPAWSILIPSSSPLPGSGTSDTYSDGRPCSTHTYALCVADQLNGRFMMMGLGSRYVGGSESAAVFGFPLANPMTVNPSIGWYPASTFPSVPLNGGGAANTQATCAVYDEDRAKIWQKQQGSNGVLQCFDCATGTWSTFGDGLGFYSIDTGMAIHPWHRYIVSIGGYANNGPLGGGASQICLWNLNTAISGSITAVTRTCTGLPGGAKWGIRFDPPSNTFLAWNGGQTVYQLTPPADPLGSNWTATAITMGGSTAPSASATGTGTYSKWQRLDYPNDPTQRVYAFFAVDGSYTVTNMFLWKPNF